LKRGDELPPNQLRFFSLLVQIIGNEGELHQNGILLFPNDFFDRLESKYELHNKFIMLLNEFNTTNDFPLHNGPRYDGKLIGHPMLGSRLIEFDEEQHFTPHRMKTIEVFGTELSFASDYESLFLIDHLRQCSLIKNRISHALTNVEFMDLQVTIQAIIEYVEMNDIHNNFIRETSGFRYSGGRLAQRAIYDLIKDLYHLIEPNFSQIIRFSLFEFEQAFNSPFNQCTDDQISNYVMKKLSKLS